jgi:putative tryptophan/tyrosine transport system substrate-binding protein
MRRREFFSLVGSAAVAWPLAARAQQPAMPVVGFLTGATRDGFEPYVSAFRDGLQKAGFVAGRNLAIEYRYADDHYDRLSSLAAELIKRPVAVIATDPRGVFVAQALTQTIPIVFMSGSDPVRRGLVTSLNRPGGNLTGVTILAGDLNGKRFGLLHDLVPQAAVIGVLSDPGNSQRGFAEEEVQAAARSLGMTVRVIAAGTESEIEAAFATFAREGVSAVFVINSFLFFSVSDRLDELALRHRIALSGELRKFVNGGGLMSYGPNLVEAYRQVGVYTGRILNGEKPADLPVQQPTTFELVINLRTAKALGLTVSQSLLSIADEVIE